MTLPREKSLKISSPDAGAVPSVRIGERVLPIDVRINRRARRLIIRVDALGGRVQLTCPSKRSVPDGLSFVEKRRQWIAKCLAEGPQTQPFYDGASVPARGIDHLIRHVPGQRKAVRAEGTTLHIGGAPEFLARRVEDWLRAEARREFCAIADDLCGRIGVVRKRITVRDTRSRWGSCSSAGAISLSWRLIMAPEHVYTYVVGHEVAHLKHMDHSPAFWRVVDELIPDRRPAQDWLKAHGASLYGIGAR